jgi:N6-adenosine-specific RNA methylase IME4
MALITVQTCFARGKEKFREVESSTRYVSAIIDPDWPYTVAPGMKSLKDVANAESKGRLSGFTRNKDESLNQYRQKYPMSIERMKKLRVPELVSGYILMWTVGPFLINGSALEILKAWGFEPCSILTWAKYDLKNSHGYGGVGFWFLGNAEFCIVAKREGFPSIRTGKSSMFIAPKTRHSEKPINVHQLCEQRFPGPYVEIFGRKDREDWLVLGDEVTGCNIEESIDMAIAGKISHNVKSYSKSGREENGPLWSGNLFG